MSWCVSPWVYPVWDSLCLLNLTISFSMLGKFSTIISSENLSYPFFFSSSSSAAAAKLLQLCLTLCDPIEGGPTGSSVPGILQARTLEWVAISLFNAWKWKVKVKLFSCARLLATPWTVAYQAPPSMGFSRQEYWSGVPLPSPKVCLRWFQISICSRLKSRQNSLRLPQKHWKACFCFQQPIFVKQGFLQ